MRILSFLVFFTTTLSAQVAENRTVTLMGSRFDITIVAKDKQTANKYIDSSIIEITRIENLISEWIPSTQVSQINRNAGIKPVKVDKELFDLTQRAIGFSKLTDGAFDISFAAADKIWKFDGSMTEMPSAEAVKESVAKIGYENIVLDPENLTVFLKLPGMKIGFGATGKGYAADKTKALMQSNGIKAGIINASGDMNSWGKQPNGKNWTLGITDPANPGDVLAVLPLKNAVVTSGNYEKFVTIDHKRYSHIIDPRTGYPANGLVSVTVFSESAETANGFSTAIMVLGKDAGLKLIDKTPGLSAVIIDENQKIWFSKNLNIRKHFKRK